MLYRKAWNGDFNTTDLLGAMNYEEVFSSIEIVILTS